MIFLEYLFSFAFFLTYLIYSIFFYSEYWEFFFKKFLEFSLHILFI